MASSDKNVTAFGKAFSLHYVDYSGESTTFQVDASASVVATVWPASGPAATVAAGSAGLRTVTLAAGGQNVGGKVIVVATHGNGINPAGYIGNHA